MTFKPIFLALITSTLLASSMHAMDNEPSSSNPQAPVHHIYIDPMGILLEQKSNPFLCFLKSALTKPMAIMRNLYNLYAFDKGRCTPESNEYSLFSGLSRLLDPTSDKSVWNKIMDVKNTKRPFGYPNHAPGSYYKQLFAQHNEPRIAQLIADVMRNNKLNIKNAATLAALAQRQDFKLHFVTSIASDDWNYYTTVFGKTFTDLISKAASVHTVTYEGTPAAIPDRLHQQSFFENVLKQDMPNLAHDRIIFMSKHQPHYTAVDLATKMQYSEQRLSYKIDRNVRLLSYNGPESLDLLTGSDVPH